VWYHPGGSPPTFDPPDLDGLVPAEFAGPFVSIHEVQAPAQELAENGVDAAHFKFMHGTDTVARLDSYQTDGPLASMRSRQSYVTA
jgi:hypothetical protein